MQTDPASPQIPGAQAETPLIVFGRRSGKPHASRFDPADAALAEKAAGLMGMQVLRVASADEAALASSLPAGRIFASGRGFVPFVKAEVFAKLEAAPGAFTPARPPDALASAPGEPKGGLPAEAGPEGPGELPEAPDGPGKPPTDWASIAMRSLVLAAEEADAGVWYVATVVAQRGDDLFELQWRDWPDEPVVVRRREHLGLIPPALAGALA